MGYLKSSGIIYQAQYFEEDVSIQVGGRDQGAFSRTTHSASSIQTTADIVPLDASAKKIIEKNKKLLAKMSSESPKKSYKAIDYSVAYARGVELDLDEGRQIEKSVSEEVESDDNLEPGVSDDLWGIGKYQKAKQGDDESDSIFNFDDSEDSGSKKFEDFSTLMGSREKRQSKKGKKKVSDKKTKRSRFRFRKERKGDSSSKSIKKTRRKEKTNRVKNALADQENDSKLKISLSLLKQDMPVRIIIGIIAGIAFVAVVVLGRVL